jgi:hypothetical protein
MITVPFVRELKAGVPGGPDVQAVKRAVSRAGYFPWNEHFDDEYNPAIADAVAVFQRQHGLHADGVYGPATHDKLRATRREGHPAEWAFDHTAVDLMAQAAHSGTAKAEQLLAVCRTFTGSYLYGGGHGVPLANLRTNSRLDCSSSTSLALYRVGLFPGPYATNSTGFEAYGEPGAGKYVTLHCNGEHVWVEMTIPGEPWCRFDTSPWGDGPNGPRVRTGKRGLTNFYLRHPNNL